MKAAMAPKINIDNPTISTLLYYVGTEDIRLNVEDI
jgi:hypothetical protein